jgi:sugar lactone lactonase YvrE
MLPARASGPKFWTTATATEFLAGRSEGVYVSLQGVVTTGPHLTSRLSTSSPAQVWALARAEDGTLWAGTGGGQGRVLRLRPGQDEETVYEAEESNVFALALDGDRIYAATSPDGRVIAIAPDGTSTTVFDPEEQYIWALAADDAGNLWVGTGTPAVLYRVGPGGDSEVVYRPPADHVVALARGADGRMLAGTESPGRLYRFDDGDRPFVVLDSGMAELRAVAAGGSGQLYAAAVEREAGASGNGETTSVAAITASSGGRTTPSSSPGASPSSASSSASSTPRSRVFRIEPGGHWEQIWQSPDLVYDLIALGEGGVLAATGPAGRLYRITDDRQVLLYTGVDARQITRFGGLAPETGRLAAFATANPGRVVAVGDGVESPATYLSDVHDTNSVATWGLLRWEAEGRVALSTRSGNTEEPDDSWSAWTEPYPDAAGSGITSPPARFLQWRAELTESAAPPATLTAVTVAYLPRNTRPRVASVTVHPPGVVFQRPFTSDDTAIAGLDDAVADARRPPGDTGPPSPSPGRRMFRKGLQTITWSADDPDEDDRLSYALEYRRDGDEAWRELRRDLRDQIYVWETTAMADGRYVVRVVASDGPTNPSDRALAGSRESAPIVIDNTPPAVTTEITGQGDATRVLVEVEDLRSPILTVEYSLRGGPWQAIYPTDGLADSLSERYEIAVASREEAAEIVVRATDRLQNVTSRAVGGGRRQSPLALTVVLSTISTSVVLLRMLLI